MYTASPYSLYTVGRGPRAYQNCACGLPGAFIHLANMLLFYVCRKT